MKHYKVKIEGLTPLRMNRRSNAKSQTKTRITEEELTEDAHRRTHKDSEGKYIIPKEAIRKCISNGATKVRLGRGRASKELTAILVVDEDAKLEYKEAEIVEEFANIPPGPKGAMVPKRWVQFPEWKAEFNISLIVDDMPLSVIKDSLNQAGIYYGLLSDIIRGKGKFVLTQFKETKD